MSARACASARRCWVSVRKSWARRSVSPSSKCRSTSADRTGSAPAASTTSLKPSMSRSTISSRTWRTRWPSASHPNGSRTQRSARLMRGLRNRWGLRFRNFFTSYRLSSALRVVVRLPRRASGRCPLLSKPANVARPAVLSRPAGDGAQCLLSGPNCRSQQPS